jgi:hypothetical protein
MVSGQQQIAIGMGGTTKKEAHVTLSNSMKMSELG